MANAVSPLAVSLPDLPPVAGVRLSATAAGIRYQDRTDVVMMEAAAGSTVAGVFTSNKCPGAPVDWCRASLRGGKARMVVVNAGNANVFTGRAGREACAATAEAAAKLADCAPSELPSSSPWRWSRLCFFTFCAGIFSIRWCWGC